MLIFEFIRGRQPVTGIKEILKAVRDYYFEDPTRYCRHSLFADAPSAQVARERWRNGEDPRVCVLGGIRLVSSNGVEETELYLNKVAKRHYARSTSMVNDDLGYDATLDLLDKAIAEAK